MPVRYLYDLSLVDSHASEEFDRYTRLASKMLNVPVSLVSIVEFEKNRQFFTSAFGLGEPWASQRQTPLTHSFCQHVVTGGSALVVEDARKHPLVKDNLAIRDLDVIAYLGIPVEAPDGTTLGALCAIDSAPRTWSKEDVSTLSDLASSVTNQISLRAALLDSEASREAANRLGSIVENSNYEVFTFDPNTLRFVSVNKGARENLGYSQGEIQQLTPVDIKPAFSSTEFEDLVAPLRRGERSKLEFETLHERKDGTHYPVSIRLEYHCDAAKPIFIAFCIDVTKQRQLESALTEKTENFAALFDNAHEPMAISDPDTKILLANPAFEKLLGQKIEKVIGTSWVEHLSEKYHAEIKERLAAATPKTPLFSVSYKQGKSHNPKSMIWSNFVHFESGKATKIFSIANDVTELQDAKIRAEQKAEEARKAIEIRKVFLANMSHEVRTPLNAIMGLFQLIQMADVPERQKKQAEVGLEASHHLLSQLVNVLEMSRVEANAVEISAQATEIAPLAQQWLETANATNHRLGKPIEVSLEIAQDTPDFVLLDARRVTQIVNNLTDNALKFTKEGHVAIQVRPVKSPVASEGLPLEITVSDTGCGIPKNKHSMIFERFVQIDDAQTRENSGSGLGLAISQELAELMNGSLAVKSKVEKSNSTSDCFATTFSLRLRK